MIIIRHKITPYGNTYIVNMLTYALFYSNTSFTYDNMSNCRNNPWVHDLVLRKTNKSNAITICTLRSLPYYLLP